MRFQRASSTRLACIQRHHTRAEHKADPFEVKAERAMEVERKGSPLLKGRTNHIEIIGRTIGRLIGLAASMASAGSRPPAAGRLQARGQRVVGRLFPDPL